MSPVHVHLGLELFREGAHLVRVRPRVRVGVRVAVGAGVRVEVGLGLGVGVRRYLGPLL